MIRDLRRINGNPNGYVSTKFQRLVHSPLSQQLIQVPVVSMTLQTEAVFDHQAQKMKRLFLWRRDMVETDLTLSKAMCGKQFSSCSLFVHSSGQAQAVVEVLGKLGFVVIILQSQWHPLSCPHFFLETLGWGSPLGLGSLS